MILEAAKNTIKNGYQNQGICHYKYLTINIPQHLKNKHILECVVCFFENKYDNNSKLLHTDIDRLMREIKTEDVYEDFSNVEEFLVNPL